MQKNCIKRIINKPKFIILIFIILIFIIYNLNFLYVHDFKKDLYLLDNITHISQTDAIIIFFSDFNNDKINNESQRRLNYALQLYNNYVAKYLIFVGGARFKKKLFGSQIMAEIAIRKGVEKENIIYERSSNDTISNIKEALKIIKNHNFKKVLFISSIYPIRRIKKLFEYLSFNEICKIDFISYEENKISPYKSILESYVDYSYNQISYYLFIVLPYSFYCKIINQIRA